MGPKKIQSLLSKLKVLSENIKAIELPFWDLVSKKLIVREPWKTPRVCGA